MQLFPSLGPLDMIILDLLNLVLTKVLKVLNRVLVDNRELFIQEAQERIN